MVKTFFAIFLQFSERAVKNLLLQGSYTQVIIDSDKKTYTR